MRMKTNNLIKLLTYSLAVILLTQLTACGIATRSVRHDGPPDFHVDVAKIPDAVPKVEPRSPYGNPPYYTVNGKRIYVLKSGEGYSKVGFASWYGTKFNGELTSTRVPYNMLAMTAASPTLPIPCYVQVTNLQNGRSIIVQVNDRGPFAANRILDLSYVAAKKLGYANHGTALVRVTYIDPRQWAKNRYAPIPTAPLPDHFYVQVGAFASLENAELFKKRVAAITSSPVTIKSAYSDNRQIYRVQVGPLVADASNALREQLEEHGLAPGINVVI